MSWQNTNAAANEFSDANSLRSHLKSSKSGFTDSTNDLYGSSVVSQNTLDDHDMKWSESRDGSLSTSSLVGGLMCSGDSCVQNGQEMDDGVLELVMDKLVKLLDNEELKHISNGSVCAEVKSAIDLLGMHLKNKSGRLMGKRSSEVSSKMIMAFLNTVPMFQSLTAEQLEKLCSTVSVQQYGNGECIIRQGEVGTTFYIIQHGKANVRIQEEITHDTIVATLHAGDGFGERALLNDEKRSASVEANGLVVCLEIRKSVFESILSDSVHLLGGYSSSQDCEEVQQAKSFENHIKEVAQASNKAKLENAQNKQHPASMDIHLLPAFSPELASEDTVERLIRAIQIQLNVERIGLFMLSADKKSMLLLISKEVRGVSMPLSGLAGFTAQTGETLIVADAYQDPRFDDTMDKKLGNVTKQVLCVPVFRESDDAMDDVLAVVQCINRTGLKVNIPFNAEDEQRLKVATKYLCRAFKMNDSQKPHVKSFSLPDVRLSSQIGGFTGEYFQNKHDTTYNIKVRLLFGCNILDQTSGQLPHSSNLKDESPACHPMIFKIPIANVPFGSRIIFDIYQHQKIIGWTGQYVYNLNNQIENKCFQIGIRLGEEYVASTIVSSLENKFDQPNAFLKFRWSGLNDVVHYASPPIDADSNLQVVLQSLNNSSTEKLNRIIKLIQDPFYELKSIDKQVLWELRRKLVSTKEALIWFLKSIPWTDHVAVEEAYQLLYMWEPPSAIDALGLLNVDMPDPKIRAYAVQCLENFDDDHIALYLPQLVQAIKYERYHDSALTRFLVRRSIGNTKLIGHMLFWSIKAEMHLKAVQFRYGLLLETYLRHCGEHRLAIGHQCFLVRKLRSIHKEVKRGQTLDEKNEILRQSLRNTILPDTFMLPLKPDFCATGIDIDKCHVLGSARKPLYLVFEDKNSNCEPLHAMYKNGDDLRQDQLILQLLKIMAQMWQGYGLDTRMTVYGCIATDEKEGMIEIVQEATTIAGIVSHNVARKGSGKKGSAVVKLKSAFGAMESSVIEKWLQSSAMTNRLQPTMAESRTYDAMTENFYRSCAGYCVATYVLGIGDRHNDNIMVSKNGKMFHIDFGHVFGNFKSKLGIQRERSPFVFTPAFCKVIGHPGAPTFNHFTQLACDAYRIVRKNAFILHHICSIMISSEIKEIATTNNFQWMRSQLCLHLENDKDVETHFTKLIHKSLRTKSTQLNDAAHMLRHA